MDDYPASLRLWGRGEESLHHFLAALNVHPIALQRDEVHRVGPHLTAMRFSVAHHNQVGVMTAWAIKYLRGRAQEGDAAFEEFARAFETAGLYWSLKNVLADVALGTRTFEASGRTVRFPYVGNAAFDATDRLLEMLDSIQSMPEGPPTAFEALFEWERTGGRDLPWEATPLEMREELRAFGRSIAVQQAAYLDRGLDMGGFTMGEAEQVVLELFARAWHSAAQIMLGSVRMDVVAPAYARDALIGQLAMTTKVASSRIAVIVDLLTTDLAACDDPCLTPLVPLPTGQLVLMSSLLTPGALVRNITARIQLDPTRFGEAGRLLGLLGSRTVGATLRKRLSDSKVTERVKVFHPDGRQAGDFDVVAFDPATNELVVFEVLWRIGLDGSADIAQLENRAHLKRDQVSELRDDIAAGARARWPHGWAVPANATYRWFILTPSILPALVHDDAGIPVRSHQVLERFQWNGKQVADMVAALENPPPPPAELSATYWVSGRYGRYDVHLERLRA